MRSHQTNGNDDTNDPAIKNGPTIQIHDNRLIRRHLCTVRGRQTYLDHLSAVTSPADHPHSRCHKCNAIHSQDCATRTNYFGTICLLCIPPSIRSLVPASSFSCDIHVFSGRALPIACVSSLLDHKYDKNGSWRHCRILSCARRRAGGKYPSCAFVSRWT